MSKLINVDQTLHGYSEGHRLLAASFALDSGSERTLSSMSDMSGPTMLKGFRCYLTGYPLKSAERYSFARTWYAEEMERPGCVWTHTLFLKFRDMEQLRSVGPLQRLFQRPDSPSAWTAYKIPLEIRMGEKDSGRQFEPLEYSPELVSPLLLGLYGNPDKSVYLPVDHSAEIEELIVRVWSQQWPALRSLFSFCTGSLSNRKIEGESFHLQAIPRSRLVQFLRDAPEGYFLKDIKNLDTVPHWLSAASSDLHEPRSRFGEFLEKYSGDVRGERKFFQPMAELCSVLAPNREKPIHIMPAELSAAVNILAKAFPDKDRAGRLKMDLLGPKDRSDLPPFLVPEESALFEISKTPFCDSFPITEEEIEDRGAKLAERSPQSAIHLVDRFLLVAELNHLGQSCLKGLLGVLGKDDEVLARQYSTLILSVVRHNPEAARSAKIWRAMADRQQELLDVVIESSPADEILDKVIWAALDAECYSIVERIRKKLGEKQLKRVLDWFDSSRGNQNIADALRAVFRTYPSALVQWLRQSGKPSVSTLRFALGVLDPESTDVLNLGAPIWEPIAASIKEQPTASSAFLSEMAFLLAIGLRTREASAARLVATTFQPIHDAAARERLPYEDWSRIEKATPEPAWWQSWDRCERMRRALVFRFIECEWPLQRFLDAIGDRETLLCVFDFCRRDASTRKFMKKVIQGVQIGKLVASEHHGLISNMSDMQEELL